MRKNNYLYLLVYAVVSLIFCGCANQNTASSQGWEVRVRFADVSDVRRNPMSAPVPADSTLGGFKGLAVYSGSASGQGRDNKIANRAILEDMSEKMLDEGKLYYIYELQFADSTVSQYITEKDYIQEGDCVAVEDGQFNNLRRVPISICRLLDQVKPDPVQIENAEKCLAAKGELLETENNKEFIDATLQVEILCEF